MIAGTTISRERFPTFLLGSVRRLCAITLGGRIFRLALSHRAAPHERVQYSRDARGRSQGGTRIGHSIICKRREARLLSALRALRIDPDSALRYE